MKKIKRGGLAKKVLDKKYCEVIKKRPQGAGQPTGLLSYSAETTKKR